MDISKRAEAIGLSEAQCEFFYSQGYLKLDSVLTGAFFSRVQSEFERVEEETREEWMRSVAANPEFRPYRMNETSHVVFPVTPHGDVFVDLLEYPQTLSVAESFMGPDVVMSDNALHVKPSSTISHADWHRDSPTWKYEDGWSVEDEQAWESLRVCETPFLKIKIFYFVHDVDEATSPFSVVPGSHKWDSKDIPEYDELSDMPGHVKLTGKAGDALLWNGCILHATMDNTDTKARRMLFYNYIHFGQKRHEPCVPTGEFKESLKDRSPFCRQLFGLERMER